MAKKLTYTNSKSQNKLKIKIKKSQSTAVNHFLLNCNIQYLYALVSDALNITRGNIRLKYTKYNKLELNGIERAVDATITLLISAPDLATGLVSISQPTQSTRTQDQDFPSPDLEINNDAVLCVKDIFKEISNIKNSDLSSHIEYAVSYSGYTQKSMCTFTFKLP